jgi:iron complex transport system substrate-binding protein
MFPLERIICLTEETVETLYLLEAQDRIRRDLRLCRTAATGRREKPRVSAFTSANVEKILALKPDLVLAFSDLPADIVAGLIRHDVEVHAFNQRSIAAILDMIRLVGTMVGDRAGQLVGTLEARLGEARSRRSSCRDGRGCSSRSGTIR